MAYKITREGYVLRETPRYWEKLNTERCMESFFNKIELLLELLIEVELIHPDCPGVTIIRPGADGAFTVHSWTEFTIHEPEEAETAFRERLLPTGGWLVSPYSRARAHDAIRRRLAEIEELNIEL